MKIFLALIVSMLLMACQSKPEPGRTSDALSPQRAALKAPSPEQAEPDNDELTEPESTPQPQPDPNRQIIRTAQVRIRVNDFTTAGNTIDRMVKQAGGQITSSNETKSYNTIENAVVIRVAAAGFDALLTNLLKESIFTDTKSITTDDVTRRYVDTEARIRSKRAVEETYLKLLKQARNVEDVLKIEEQLAAIREEREVQEAELRQLKDEVTRSTINLTYYQQTEAALRPEAPFYRRIWNDLTDGFGLIGHVFVGVFYFLPLIFIIGGISWLIARWRRKQRIK